MRVALVVFVGVVSAAALLFLLPWLKEGYDTGELPLFAGIGAGLAVLALLASRQLRGQPRLRAAGLLCLAPPLLAYVLLALDVLADAWRGRTLGRAARIVSLRETPIEWPGFDGPVGLRLEIELAHRVTGPGNLFAPKLRLGGPESPTHGDYFGGRAFGGREAAFLQQPVYQYAGRWELQPRLLGSPSKLVYDLYPWKVQTYEVGRKVCFGKWDHDRRPASATGGQLGASWMFAARGGVTVDLSQLLTDELRARSRYQGRRDEWEKLMSRLEPANLAARGFAACDDPQTGERCYCAAPPAEARAR